MTIIANDDDFTVINGKKVLKDGRKITVSAFLMDSASVDAARHKPGSMPLTDATAIERRDAAYGDYITNLNDAWRTPAPVIADDKKPAAKPPAVTDHGYGAMVSALGDAWKGAAA